MCGYADSCFVEHRGYTPDLCSVFPWEMVMRGCWQGAHATRVPGASVTVLTPRRVITWSVSPQHLSFYLSAGKTPFPSYHPTLKSPFLKKTLQHVWNIESCYTINLIIVFISCFKIYCFTLYWCLTVNLIWTPMAFWFKSNPLWRKWGGFLPSKLHPNDDITQ